MFKFSLFRPQLRAISTAAINVIFQHPQRKESFNQAISLDLIDLAKLKSCPKDKLLEISSLFEPQKHYSDALVSLYKYNLYTVDALIQCDIPLIQAYKKYLFELSPAVVQSGAQELSRFKIAYEVESMQHDPELYFSARGCG